jgi:hypothetical protein
MFCSLQRPDQLWDPPGLFSNCYHGVLSPAVKRPGCEADRLPPSSAEVKNVRAVPSLHHTFHGIVLNYIIKYSVVAF